MEILTQNLSQNLLSKVNQQLNNKDFSEHGTEKADEITMALKYSFS